MVYALDFSNYKEFLNARLKAMPKGGHGQLRKIAEALRVNSVVMSQILRGLKHFTPEQSVEIARYFGFSELESEYFLLLVQKERAGSVALQAMYEKRMSELRAKSENLKDRLPVDKVLSEEAKAIFYTNWYYSGVRVLASLDGFRNPDAIAERLELPAGLVRRVIDFLLATGLCVERPNGEIDVGPRRTHLGADSPFISRHHANWRMKGLSKMDAIAPHELFYTGPMSISHDGALSVRKELISLIERAGQLAGENKPERTACLNIDWFEF